MNCPYDSTTLQVDNNDPRGEWEEINYTCPHCHRSFTEHIKFKSQSRLVHSDILFVNIGDNRYDTESLDLEQLERLEKKYSKKVKTK